MAGTIKRGIGCGLLTVCGSGSFGSHGELVGAVFGYIFGDVDIRGPGG